MAKKIGWKPAFIVVVARLALSNAGCALLDGIMKPTASEEIPNPYKVEAGEIKSINGNITTGKLNLVNLPQGVKGKKNPDGEIVEQISVVKASQNGKTTYVFMTEYPRHCLHVKIDNAPSVEVVSEKRDGDIVLTDTMFPVPSAMLKSLRNCKTLILQAESVKSNRGTVDYMSAIMMSEPEAIAALQKLLE